MEPTPGSYQSAPSAPSRSLEAVHRRETGVPTQLATGRGNPRVSGPQPQAATSESLTVRSQRDGSDLASALGPPVPSVPTRAYLVAAAAAEVGAPGASKLPWRVRPAAGRPGANRSGPGVVETDSPVVSLRSAHSESDGAELRAPRNPACCGLQGLGWALCQGVCAAANQSMAAGPPPGGTTWDSLLWVSHVCASTRWLFAGVLGSLRASHTAQILFDVIK